MSSSISSSLQGSNLQHFSQPYATVHTERAAQLKTSTRANLDVTLTTAEGDKVTLSAKSAARAAYTTYDARGRLRGTPNIHAESLSVDARQEVAVMVEGDLNAEELADLAKLFERLQNIATDFFTGDRDQALDGGLAVHDLDSIASFGASMELHQRLSVAQSTATYGHANAASLSAVDAVVDNMVQAVDGVQGTVTQLGQRLSALVADFFDGLLDQSDLDATGRQRVAQASTRFAQRLALMTQTKGEPHASTETAAAAPAQTAEPTEPEPTTAQPRIDGELNILS